MFIFGRNIAVPLGGIDIIKTKTETTSSHY